MSRELAYKPFGKLLRRVVDNRGKTCPTSRTGIPLIATNCIRNENLYPVYEKVRFVSDEVHKTWFRGHPEPGDMIFVTKGTPGRVCWVPEPVDFCIAQDMVAIRANEKEVYPKYLFAALRSKQLQDEIENLHVGSLIPHFKKGDFDDLKIPIPDGEQQKFIGDFYFTLSLKIDLLHRQNRTLEALAETFFREWFVEEGKDNWTNGRLKDFGEIICGKTPPKKVHTYFGGNIPFIKIPDMHREIFIFETEDSLTEEGANSQANKYLPAKSICVSCIATVGLVSMNASKSQTNQQINSIVPKAEHYRYFVYLQLKAMKDELLAMASGGTATLNLNTGEFSNLRTPKPPEDVLKDFHRQVKTLFDKIFCNQEQIRSLTKVRDALLPKLISGEVTVKY